TASRRGNGGFQPPMSVTPLGPPTRTVRRIPSHYSYRERALRPLRLSSTAAAFMSVPLARPTNSPRPEAQGPAAHPPHTPRPALPTPPGGPAGRARGGAEPPQPPAGTPRPTRRTSTGHTGPW